jgi:hypothetical protein
LSGFFSEHRPAGSCFGYLVIAGMRFLPIRVARGGEQGRSGNAPSGKPLREQLHKREEHERACDNQSCIGSGDNIAGRAYQCERLGV